MLGTQEHRFVAIGALVLVQLFFGSWPVAGKVALTSFPPLALTALRTGAGALLLWGLHWSTSRVRVERRDLPRLAVYALFGVVLNQVFFILGLARTEPVAASVLITTIPVWTLLVALLFRVEQVGWRKGAGIATAFVGVCVMLGVGSSSFSKEHAVGNLFVTINALAYAIFLVLARDMARKYPPVTLAAWLFTFGVIGIIPLAWSDLMRVDWGAVPSSTWWVYAYIVVFITAAPYVLNNFALARVSATTVATFIYLQPILATFLTFLVFHTVPTERTAVGAVFIFIGVWLAAIARTRFRFPLRWLRAAGP